MKVKQIRYEVEGRARTHPDGVAYDIRLYKDDAIVFEKMPAFSGHSCTACPEGKALMAIRDHKLDPAIAADMIEIIAHDIEAERQYIVVNGTRFHIPPAANNAIVTHQFSLSEPSKTVWLYIGIAIILLYLLTRG